MSFSSRGGEHRVYRREPPREYYADDGYRRRWEERQDRRRSWSPPPPSFLPFPPHDREREWSPPGRRGGPPPRSLSRSRSPPPRRRWSPSRRTTGRSRDHRAFPGGYVEKNRLFVGGVPKTTTAERFRSHFEQFGNVERIELTAERSFGFVTFQDQGAVETCLQQRMHPFRHTAHNIAFVEVRRPLPRRAPFPSRNY